MMSFVAEDMEGKWPPQAIRKWKAQQFFPMASRQYSYDMH